MVRQDQIALPVGCKHQILSSVRLDNVLQDWKGCPFEKFDVDLEFQSQKCTGHSQLKTTYFRIFCRELCPHSTQDHKVKVNSHHNSATDRFIIVEHNNLPSSLTEITKQNQQFTSVFDSGMSTSQCMVALTWHIYMHLICNDSL